jgi:kynurenine formamidase
MVGALLVGCSNAPEPVRFPQGQWIDLSYDYSSETIYWPTADSFHLEEVAHGYSDRGFFYASNNFSASEHGGTHVDAPIHFAENKWTLDQIPFEQMMGPAAVIDVTEAVTSNPDYLVSIADFEAWEETHGAIPDGAIVFLRTGFGQYWPNAEQYLGTSERGPEAVAKLHFPGLSPEAAQWLTDHRTIGAVGLDTPSIDYGQSKDFMSHQVLLSGNVPVLENVANLDELPATGAWVIALPMKIKGGSGGPVMIAGYIPDTSAK